MIGCGPLCAPRRRFAAARIRSEHGVFMTNWQLRKLDGWDGIKGPVVVCVMDGVGIGARRRRRRGRARAHARRSTRCRAARAVTHARARTARPSACRATTTWATARSATTRSAPGRVFDQGAKLVDAGDRDAARCSRATTWQAIVAARARHAASRCTSSACSPTATCTPTSTTCSRCSSAATQRACSKVRVHALLDGRDVPETSALDLRRRARGASSPSSTQRGRDYRIASGGGRMMITMDRYEADWRMVERGWQAHVLGDGRGVPQRARGRSRRCRDEQPGISDQNLPPFVIVDDDGKPVGPHRRRRRASCSSTSAATARSRSRGLRGRATSTKFDRGRAPGRPVRRHDAVRRRPAHARSTSWSRRRRSSARWASTSRATGVAPARDQRDPEVRPRHLLLERQPQRHVRRRSSRRYLEIPSDTRARSRSGRG